MKKFMSLLLAVALCLATYVPAYAYEKEVALNSQIEQIYQ
jgi:hypothetical protein